MVRLAVAVDAANVPARGVLVAELAPPVYPVTVTVTVVPSGILEAASVTVIGLAAAAGNTMSGLEKEPVGEAGTVKGKAYRPALAGLVERLVICRCARLTGLLDLIGGASAVVFDYLLDFNAEFGCF